MLKMDDLAEYKWSIWLKIKTPALRDAGAKVHKKGGQRIFYANIIA